MKKLKDIEDVVPYLTFPEMKWDDVFIIKQLWDTRYVEPEPIPSDIDSTTQDDTDYDLVNYGHVIGKVMSLLPERSQIVLDLRFDEGLTLAEVSEILGMNVRKVCQIECAALRTLRGFLCTNMHSLGPRLIYVHT